MVVISILPLIYAIDAAFYKETMIGLTTQRSLKAIYEVYFTSEYLSYFWNALSLGFIVTVISVVYGVGMALIISRTDIPFKNTLDLLTIMPMFVSPFTGLIAWISLGSEKTGFINGVLAEVGNFLGFSIEPLVNIWTFGGIVWVMVLFFCPFVYLFTIGNLRGMDSTLEEAARTSGAGTFYTLTRITLPVCLPAILSASLLVFILSTEVYTMPGILGAPDGFVTLTWQIYQDSTTFPVHRAHAAASGTMILWIAVAGLWLQRRLTRKAEKFVTVTGKGFRGKPIPLGVMKWPALIIVGAYIIFADILPLIAIVLSSLMKYSSGVLTADIFTISHYVKFFSLSEVRLALWNTMMLAALAGAVCVVLGFLISYFEVRRSNRVTVTLAFLGTISVAVPGLIYGIGMLWLYLKTPLYGTVWILLLAFVAKYLPYGILVSRSGILQVHPDLEQSARVHGASPLRVIRSILIPIAKPTLIAVLFFVMLSSIKELSASLLLYSQKSPILSVLTWNYMDGGEYQFASAVGVVQTILMIGIVIITRIAFRIKLEAATLSK